MVFIQLKKKVKTLIYCEDLDYLTVCLESGTLITLQLEVSQQGFVCSDDEPEKTLRWMSKCQELTLEKKLLQSSDNLLFFFNYLQNEADTPQLDLRDPNKFVPQKNQEEIQESKL